MKTNKGFTLIELLAVIVILAIIALIATPTILGVIETARKGAAESSALGYIDAVEKHIAIAKVDNNVASLPNGTYAVSDLQTAGVEVKGDYPSTTLNEGYVTIDNGEVTRAVLLVNEQYYVTYNPVADNVTTVAMDKPTMETTNVTCTSTVCTLSNQGSMNNDINGDENSGLDNVQNDGIDPETDNPGTINDGTETGTSDENQNPNELPTN